MTDVFQVGGTTFRFPIVPDDAVPAAKALANERRDSVLAAARKVRPFKNAKPAERVNLLTVPMRVPAGSTFAYSGWPYDDRDHSATVSVPGPAASSVWATDDDTGEWLCLTWSGRRKAWERDNEHTDAARYQRRAVVRGYVSADHARSGGYGRQSPADVVRATWLAWHALYPSRPFDFELIETPTERNRYGDPNRTYAQRSRAA